MTGSCIQSCCKVLICKNGITRCVRQSKVAQKLANGATLGPCTNFNHEGSDRFSVSSGVPTAVERLTVYPNPVFENAEISFKAETATACTLELFDINGRRVKTIFNDRVEKDHRYQQSFERGNLKAGIYLLRLSNDQGWIDVKKLIVH